MADHIPRRVPTHRPRKITPQLTRAYRLVNRLIDEIPDHFTAGDLAELEQRYASARDLLGDYGIRLDDDADRDVLVVVTRILMDCYVTAGMTGLVNGLDAVAGAAREAHVRELTS